MNREKWAAVDRYTEETLMPSDPHLSRALSLNVEAGLPAHDVSPSQGLFLQLMVKISGAKKILEFGTLGGYSTIWMSKVLPEDGKIITFEAVAKHAEVAAKNIQNAGVADRVDIRVGKALDILPEIEKEGFNPIDLFFIDADKENNPEYLKWAIKLSKPGSVIIADNVVREGKIIEKNSTDSKVRAIQRFNQMLKGDPSVEATTIQTVGSKGYDGFTLAYVR